jgi:hypothetical protein
VWEHERRREEDCLGGVDAWVVFMESLFLGHGGCLILFLICFGRNASR